MWLIIVTFKYMILSNIYTVMHTVNLKYFTFLCCVSYVEYGPMIRTTDADKMKKEIAKLTANGGGDVPEMCLSGLQVLR